MIKTATFLLLLIGGSLRASTTIAIVHFSDYHSHALPFYVEGGERGGLARAIGFLERAKRRGALVFNGGDMMNRGAPAWSDRYRCAEWPWFNGIVDAMAFGNHDADYGKDDWNRCRSAVAYPILSANTTGFERYRVFVRHGIRIGVFAIAGSDFPKLVTNAQFAYSDPIASARDVVDTLRNREHADAVVMIGHEHAQDDYKLASAVPGIDVILGTHTHLKRELTRIPGTQTWFISPYQYLAYVSEVELTFQKHKLASVRGRLVPIDASVKPDAKIAGRVGAMQRDLERDPVYRDLFVPIARLRRPMELDSVARFTLEAMRDAAHADAALSTTSSFRQPLPSGTIDLETLRAALPYDNEIVVGQMRGDKLQALLERANTADPASDARAFAIAPPQIDDARTYTVAVTDYMSGVSAAYRDLFEGVKWTSSGARVRSEVRKRLAAQWPSAP
ncbi:MAG TPA: 5'-nucleotidase C-terminal domain-containing protein [Thermoanaerobaculia bacterium]